MEMKVFLILVVVVCCVGAVNSSDDVQERRKRDIFENVKNWFKDAGTKISDAAQNLGTFTEDQFKKFKESFKGLSKSELEKTYDGMKDYYDKLGDQSSAAAMRVKESMDELQNEINGSSTTRSSLLAAVVFVLISIFLIG